MKQPAYSELIALLDQASDLLSDNAGDLNPADLRIRALVVITGKEAKRALLESTAKARFTATARTDPRSLPQRSRRLPPPPTNP